MNFLKAPMVFALLVFAPSSASAIEIIAHRGLSGLYPEETRPAFEAAAHLGVDYLELDVNRTQDGVLIATHDTTLNRTTNVEEVLGSTGAVAIKDVTFEFIKTLDAGSWFNKENPDLASKKFVGLKVLTLEEVLEIAEKHHRGIYLETKSPHLYPGFEAEIVALLIKRGWIDSAGSTVSGRRLILQSFDFESLRRLHKLAPGVAKTYLIGEDEKLLSNEQAIEQAKEMGAIIGAPGIRLVGDILNRFIPFLSPFGGIVDAAHRAGLVVHAWTVDPAAFLVLTQIAKADGVFTNRSDTAVSLWRTSVEKQK